MWLAQYDHSTLYMYIYIRALNVVSSLAHCIIRGDLGGGGGGGVLC